MAIVRTFVALFFISFSSYGSEPDEGFDYGLYKPTKLYLQLTAEIGTLDKVVKQYQVASLGSNKELQEILFDQVFRQGQSVMRQYEMWFSDTWGANYLDDIRTELLEDSGVPPKDEYTKDDLQKVQEAVERNNEEAKKDDGKKDPALRAMDALTFEIERLIRDSDIEFYRFDPVSYTHLTLPTKA